MFSNYSLKSSTVTSLKLFHCIPRIIPPLSDCYTKRPLAGRTLFSSEKRLTNNKDRYKWNIYRTHIQGNGNTPQLDSDWFRTTPEWILEMIPAPSCGVMFNDVQWIWHLIFLVSHPLLELIATETANPTVCRRTHINSRLLSHLFRWHHAPITCYCPISGYVFAKRSLLSPCPTNSSTQAVNGFARWRSLGARSHAWNHMKPPANL